MSKTFWKAMQLSPAVLGAIILVSNGALAASTPPTVENQTIADATNQGDTVEPSTRINSVPANNTIMAQVPTSNSTDATNVLDRINQYTENTNIAAPNPMDQVTSVSQLTDVDPNSWAFQALQSLVERYGCIEGYPDRTYRGNRAMTRYEFAAGLNSCLNRINELIAAATADLPSKEDIATIRRLQEEFAAELATLRGRVDALEARTSFLEAHQFSTTTKLVGEVIFLVAGAFGDEKAVPSGNVPGSAGDIADKPIFADRARLNFDTSFNGKDRLRARLQARNITRFDTAVTGTNMTRLSFDGNEGNDVTLGRLEYRFQLTPKTTVYLEATGAEFNDNMNTFNPLISDTSSGTISRFGRFNGLYRFSEGGAGISLNHNFSKAVGLSLGYLVPGAVAPNPNDGYGIFNGAYGALAQLSFTPSDFFSFGLTYVRSYQNKESGVNVTGSTGSLYATRPFDNVATSANNYGAQASFRFSPRFTLSGWFGYTQAYQETNNNEADIMTWATTFAFPDFGKKGNMLGIVFGQPPKVTKNDIGNREDDNTSYHLEGIYRFQVSDNISVTPGVIVIFNPENNDDNDTQYVGVIRTVFKF